MSKIKIKLNAFFGEKGIFRAFSTFLVAVLCLGFTASDNSKAASGTAVFTAKPKTIMNPGYPAAFYYQVDDDVIIFDILQVSNFDDEDITVEFVGRTEGQEGWFAFAPSSLNMPATNYFSPSEVMFSITIPDGVCEDIYRGMVFVNLQSTDSSPSGFSVTSTIAVEVVFDIQSGVPCVGGETLPGLGTPSSFIPPETFNAEVPEDIPIVVPGGGGGGGGGGSDPDPDDDVIFGDDDPDDSDPDEDDPDDSDEDSDDDMDDPEETDDEGDDPDDEDPEEEEEEPPIEVLLNIIANPEKRFPRTGNWGTIGLATFYSGGDFENSEMETTVTLNSGGNGSVPIEIAPGTYDVSYKGLSHLTKFIPGVVVTEGEDINLDYTFGGSFDLPAGDVHRTKDNYINGLDLSATIVPLYEQNVDADLNADGLVNGLDVSNLLFNVYLSGEDGV